MSKDTDIRSTAEQQFDDYVKLLNDNGWTLVTSDATQARFGHGSKHGRIILVAEPRGWSWKHKSLSDLGDTLLAGGMRPGTLSSYLRELE